MKQWWKRLAVVAAWLGVGVAAHGQGFTAGPHGAARMPEPLRYTPTPQPPLVPGPLTPQMAPAGPPPELSLPASHSNAYPLDPLSTEAAFYASLGSSFLRRWRTESGPSVFLDNGNNIDNGVLTTENLPAVMNPSDINQKYRWAGKLTLGYLLGNSAIEVNGFYQPDAESEVEIATQGRLFMQFGAPNGGFPIGFEGNNGLWRQADRVHMTFQSTLGSAEAIYRSWNGGVNGTDMLIGLRYLHVRERLGIFTDDELLVANDFGQTDPIRRAEYTVQTRTNFIGLTTGGELSVPLWQNRVWLTGMGRAAFGMNQITRTFTLNRGDGLNGFDESQTKWRFGSLYDASLGFDIHLLEKARLRFAYQGLLLLGTSTPSAEVNVDLGNPTVQSFSNREVFYHGPMIEFQMLF